MTEVTQTLLGKKLERGNNWGYNYACDNFTEEKELTVTITLAEYRSLIRDNSVAENKVDEARSNRYATENENTKLKEKVKNLENMIFEYRKKFGELESEE